MTPRRSQRHPDHQAVKPITAPSAPTTTPTSSPSVAANTNSAWTICAAMTHNMLRAAATLSDGKPATARGAPCAAGSSTCPPGSRARRRELHLPEHWPWARDWLRIRCGVFGDALGRRSWSEPHPPAATARPENPRGKAGQPSGTARPHVLSLRQRTPNAHRPAGPRIEDKASRIRRSSGRLNQRAAIRASHRSRPPPMMSTASVPQDQSMADIVLCLAAGSDAEEEQEPGDDQAGLDEQDEQPVAGAVEGVLADPRAEQGGRGEGQAVEQDLTGSS